jgi:hypothetical protein
VTRGWSERQVTLRELLSTPVADIGVRVSVGCEEQAILMTFARHGCSFVVVGSTARALLGETVRPQDLDLVVSAEPANRERLVAALGDVGAQVHLRRGRVAVGPRTPLPWEWGFRVRTPWTEIDVVTQFIDGTTIDDVLESSSTVELGDGVSVQANGTRHSA